MLIKGENAMPSDDIVKTILKRGYSIKLGLTRISLIKMETIAKLLKLI